MIGDPAGSLKVLDTEKPVTDDKNVVSVYDLKNIADLLQLQEDLRQVQDLHNNSLYEIENLREIRTNKHELVVKNVEMEKILAITKWVSVTDKPVIILGETGVGKKTIAGLLHSLNPKRKNCPIIKVSCDAIPQDLLEQEFFGYAPGSVKGANWSGKPGYFEMADKGTILLDEVNALPRRLQAKLLRVLHGQEITRPDSVKTKKVDAWALMTTNCDLESMIKENSFLKELYYSNSFIPIKIPSLRERRDEIAPLVFHYLNIYNRKYDLQKSFSDEVIECMVKYDWPGNISELIGFIERLIVTSDSRRITFQDLPQKYRIGINDQLNLKAAIEDVERYLVKKALKLYGTTYKAAEALGISQSTVVRMAKKYNLKKNRYGEV